MIVFDFTSFFAWTFLNFLACCATKSISNIDISGNIYDDMDEDVCTKMTEKALKSGINFIDTSPWYGQGLSEKRIGVALKNIPRDKYFIATKVSKPHKTAK